MFRLAQNYPLPPVLLSHLVGMVQEMGCRVSDSCQQLKRTSFHFRHCNLGILGRDPFERVVVIAVVPASVVGLAVAVAVVVMAVVIYVGSPFACGECTGASKEGRQQQERRWLWLVFAQPGE